MSLVGPMRPWILEGMVYGVQPCGYVLQRKEDLAILDHKLEHGPKRRGAGNDLLRGQRWSIAIGILAAEYAGA